MKPVSRQGRQTHCKARWTLKLLSRANICIAGHVPSNMTCCDMYCVLMAYVVSDMCHDKLSKLSMSVKITTTTRKCHTLPWGVLARKLRGGGWGPFLTNFSKNITRAYNSP
jgi:hypothetical protein